RSRPVQASPLPVPLVLRQEVGCVVAGGAPVEAAPNRTEPGRGGLGDAGGRRRLSGCRGLGGRRDGGVGGGRGGPTLVASTGGDHRQPRHDERGFHASHVFLLVETPAETASVY